MKNFGNAVNKYRIERWLYLHHLKPFAWLVRCFIYLIHNSFINYTCQIGKGTIFGYKGVGLVIQSRAKIGENCVIGTNVTIGAKPGYYEVPVIGNRVYVGTGAKIIGPVHVGDDAVIGANAVVIKDVPAGSVVGGGPPKY